MRRRPSRTDPVAQGPCGGADGGSGQHEAVGGADGSAAYGDDAAQAQPGRGLRLHELRLAGPRGRATGTPPSSARTGPRRSPRRPPPYGPRPTSSPGTASPIWTPRSEHWLGQQGRITHPMIKRPGATHYEEVGWDDASRPRSPPSCNRLDAPDEAIFYTSGRTSNEAAFVYQLFVRAYGTNNLPDCSNMCHESTSIALAESIGIGKASVTLEDVHNASLLVLAGQNPGTNHPRMLSALEEAKRRGAKILAINPLREAGLVGLQESAATAGLGRAGHRPGRSPPAHPGQRRPGPVPGLRRAAGGVGRARPRLHRRHTRSVSRPGGITCSGSTGIRCSRPPAWRGPRSSRPRAMLRDSDATVFCWAMGLTQHRNAVATIKEIANLAFAQGNIGKPGAGLLPVRGHSNVQGDRTMGIWERPPEHFLDALQAEFGFDPPREHGYDTVDAIRAMRDGHAHVFIGLGGNFVQAAPDTDGDRRRAAPDPADRADLDQDQPVAPGLRRDRADPARPWDGPRRTCRPAASRSSRWRTRPARCTPPAGRCRPASPQLRSEVAIVTGLAERHPRRPLRHRVGGVPGRLPAHPPAHRQGRAGLREL